MYTSVPVVSYILALDTLIPMVSPISVGTDSTLYVGTSRTVYVNTGSSIHVGTGSTINASIGTNLATSLSTHSYSAAHEATIWINENERHGLAWSVQKPELILFSDGDKNENKRDWALSSSVTKNDLKWFDQIKIWMDLFIQHCFI